MGDVTWIKISTDIFDNRKIRQIENLPDGDKIIVVWLKLLCLAGDVNDNGMLYITQDIPYTDETIATQLNRPLELVSIAINTFEQFGMIDIIDDIIHISNWEKYQNVEKLERIREQTRVRVARHRQNNAVTQCNTECNTDVTLCNVTDRYNVTQCNATDKEKDIDKDIDIEKVKEKESKEKEKEKECYRKPSIVRYFADEELNQEFHEYIKYRKQMKRPLSERGVTLAISTITKLAGDDPQKGVAIIDQTIERGWVGLFDIKDDKPKKKQNGFHNFEERKDSLDDDNISNFYKIMGD